MQRDKRKTIIKLLAMMFLLVGALSVAYGQSATAAADADSYKWRVDGSWWFSNPTGDFHAADNAGYFDLNKDIGFGSYSTFSGKIDWHFKKRQHLVIGISPVTSSKTATLANTIEFQGVTYNVGAQVNASLQSLSFSPGYQFDFIRRKRGYLAGAAQIFVLDTTATLKGTGTVNNVSATRSASGSVLTALPAIGPEGRWYPLHDSDRLSLDGYVLGMYFFGYGDFATAHATLGYEFHPHWNVRAGYQMGTLLDIHGSSNQIGLRLVQKGPLVGLEAQW